MAMALWPDLAATALGSHERRRRKKRRMGRGMTEKGGEDGFHLLNLISMESTWPMGIMAMHPETIVRKEGRNGERWRQILEFLDFFLKKKERKTIMEFVVGH